MRSAVLSAVAVCEHLAWRRERRPGTPVLAGDSGARLVELYQPVRCGLDDNRKGDRDQH